MIIRHETTFIFDPVKEHDAWLDFKANSNMEEWKESESTTGMAYTKTEVYHVDTKGGEDE